ncbi:glycoside hydrolase domain-containing protein [Peribacillus simplex]|uniref:glycoside hydrolase domain-containing protein n=1 Tax=Peribacillus simplex TaxID=1478 RepID=UPI003D2A0684
MDAAVMSVQVWVNSMYGGRTGFVPAPETGKTGWSTMYSLTRALQLELGITSTADNFGDGTAKAYNNFGILEMGKVPNTEQGRNIVKILQGAMYCKGYNPGGLTGMFGETMKSSIIDLQTDAGLPVRDGRVYDYVFKSFLTMDAYTLTGGDPKVREIQRALNNKYYKTSGVQPCDGHYQRGTNKALIYGLQTEIGIPAASQTGAIGPATKDGLPTLREGSTGQFVTLFQYALYFNGFDSSPFNGTYGSSVKSQVVEFQKFTKLGSDGIAGKSTWLSALVSTGDPNRKGTACDGITEVTAARAQALKNAGYTTIGRYLTNAKTGTLNKKIQPGELETIFDAGLTVFPIYQTYGGDATYFGTEQGTKDAIEAYNAAREHGFKKGTTIYFSVDFDAYGEDITNNILPHFRAIYNQFIKYGSVYNIGVYGARNVCIQVSNRGWAKHSFVSGMSTGFSGNLGYPLPSNWAFDQISTIWLGSGEGSIQIDNNIKQGRDSGQSSVSQETPSSLNEKFLKQLRDIYELALVWTKGDMVQANYQTLNFYRAKYGGLKFNWTIGAVDQEFFDHVESTLSIAYDTIEEIVDPRDPSQMIDPKHLCATLCGVMAFPGIPLIQTHYRDLVGWAGDLFTAFIQIDAHKSEFTGTNLEKTYKAALDYIAPKTKASHFSYEDFVGDIDAFNMAVSMLESGPGTVYDLFYNYYEGSVSSRFETFFKKRFDSNKDNIVKGGQAILNDNYPDLSFARDKLRKAETPNVPEYTDEEGTEVAKAFQTVFLSYLNNEII